MTGHTDWENLDDEQLLEVADALITQDEPPQEVHTLVAAILAADPADDAHGESLSEGGDST